MWGCGRGPCSDCQRHLRMFLDSRRSNASIEMLNLEQQYSLLYDYSEHRIHRLAFALSYICMRLNWPRCKIFPPRYRPSDIVRSRLQRATIVWRSVEQLGQQLPMLITCRTIGSRKYCCIPGDTSGHCASRNQLGLNMRPGDRGHRQCID